jgi:DNA ligase (NAD+)
LDSQECAKRNLTFVAWDIIKGYSDICDTLFAKLSILTSLHFNVVHWMTGHTATFEDALIILPARAKEEGYPIDGLVFKWNQCSEYEAAGRTEHHFRGGMAYKFYDETYPTKLKDIEFTMGRTGILTPVAIYEDVEIDGAVCNRASLHNLSVMYELLGRPYYSQEIEIYKANQIIPQVQNAVKLIEKHEGDSQFLIPIPTACPICGQPLSEITENTSTVLVCENENCEGKLINVINHFCSKKGLDIRGLSKATLEKLIDWGWINNFEDIFNLSDYREDWITRPGFGVKSVDNILSAIETARSQTLEKFIVALGIPLIGNAAAKEIIKIFPTWADLFNAISAEFKFYELPNFGMAMHESLISYNYTLANKLANNYIHFMEEEKQEYNLTLDNINIVITGTLTKFKNRTELTNLIINHGGKVTSSVSKNTNILINNNPNSTSSKNIAAKELNIPILTEEEFCSKYLLL